MLFMEEFFLRLVGIFKKQHWKNDELVKYFYQAVYYIFAMDPIAKSKYWCAIEIVWNGPQFLPRSYVYRTFALAVAFGSPRVFPTRLDLLQTIIKTCFYTLSISIVCIDCRRRQRIIVFLADSRTRAYLYQQFLLKL